MPLSLKLKFNLVFLALFGLGVAVSAWVAQGVLYRSAREETLQDARILMESAAAARSYTSEQVVPLLQASLGERFLPQSVPSFSATESLQRLRTKFPDFSYKEATINPTNLRDRATDWEADVVQKLRNDSGSKEFVGERSTPAGTSLYIARPIRITDGACLACHSTPAAAPKTMLDLYGSSNGFGWQQGDVVGAQIVSVPTEVPMARAHQVFRTFMLSLAGIFAAIFLAFNLMFHWIVTRRLTRLTMVANDVSLGKDREGAFDGHGRDEIGQLAQSFGRMRISLASAMTMLGE
jgi:HAMP domain-containing protein